MQLLINTFEKNKEKDAIVWKDAAYSYERLLDRYHHYQDWIGAQQISRGTVAVLQGDFSPNCIALFLALSGHGCIIVPLTGRSDSVKADLMRIAQAQISITVDGHDSIEIERLSYGGEHELLSRLRQLNHAGLVVFTSGSTGTHKGVVHDLERVLEKFKVPRRCFRAITFLYYDHMGGINTMLYVLSNAGCLVTVQDRRPDAVLQAIEKFKVDLLPTSPTFINLILLSKAYKRYNLETLHTVTYGSEPMPESTLRRFHEAFPNVQLLQTYGLTEVGALRTKSRGSDSLWVKIGGPEFQTRIVDGVLQIKAQTAMLGYLNAPSPFTEDGWFDTGDCVETDGEFIKILGRKTDILNVGGEKVYPTEVESVIQEMSNVAEVRVYGEPNLLVGNLICAQVRLLTEEDPREFTSRLKKYCLERLERYKVPVKVILTEEEQYTDRFKKARSKGTN